MSPNNLFQDIILLLNVFKYICTSISWAKALPLGETHNLSYARTAKPKYEATCLKAPL